MFVVLVKIFKNVTMWKVLKTIRIVQEMQGLWGILRLHKRETEAMNALNFLDSALGDRAEICYTD
ncbi:MAG: hypothetical protein PHI97_11750 [Desulfobulbus sp.]|nr:hypothetical protein [Desulfobulbus sp.]